MPRPKYFATTSNPSGAASNSLKKASCWSTLSSSDLLISNIFLLLRTHTGHSYQHIESEKSTGVMLGWQDLVIFTKASQVEGMHAQKVDRRKV